MNLKLKEKTMESLSAVLPITGIVLIMSIFLVPLDIGTMAMFIAGAVLLVVGMGLFQLGAEIAMNPLGEGIGVEISKSRNILLVIGASFFMGAVITIAEPDLQVLAEQVPSVPNMTLILTVAIGVGLFLALAVLRVRWKINLAELLMIMYAVLIFLSFFIPKDFLAVAFDSGGVTTGPITVPFIMAMGIGLSSVRIDKEASNDSFGLVALSSGGPILAVLILGSFFDTGSTHYSSVDIASVVTMRDVAREFALQIPRYASEVMVAIVPIAVVFGIFQLISKRYHKRQIQRISIGFIYTYAGLVMFLCGVNVGFAPVGTMLGRQLSVLSQSWLLVPIGMLIGYFIVKAEPAIQILNKQVQSVTHGTISEKSMNRCLSIGVAVSVGLSMVRVLTGIPLQWIIIPGYVLALIMTKFVPKIFIGIAFDSGGVASGPMATTFLLPLCIGACETVGGNIMTDAFGVVALVALTPLVAIQIMGVQYNLKLKKLEKRAVHAAEILSGEDEIIELSEVV